MLLRIPSNLGHCKQVKMFEAIGWGMIEGYSEPDVVYSGSERIKIIKRHEFDHGRATMSVVIEDSEGVFHAYCKVVKCLFCI